MIQIEVCHDQHAFPPQLIDTVRSAARREHAGSARSTCPGTDTAESFRRTNDSPDRQREPVWAGAERAPGQHLDDVYDQLAEIRKLIADVNAERHAEPAKVGPTNPDTSASGRSQAMQVFDNLMAQGYMYAEDWAQIEDQVLGMERKESAIFWESMFTAIENGQLQVPVPEMLE